MTMMASRSFGGTPVSSSALLHAAVSTSCAQLTLFRHYVNHYECILHDFYGMGPGLTTFETLTSPVEWQGKG